MSQLDSILLMPCFSISPSKVSLYNKVFRRSISLESYTDSTNLIKTTVINHKVKKKSNPIKRSFHAFSISDNARRTLQQKITWLNYLAKPRHIKTYSGKDIYNFKCAFITLTLPSKQKECTSEVTNQYFNQFLTEIRQQRNMQNYVWRLEFQKNGNVHYHIITDCYLDYFFVRRIWNRILSKGDYITDYHNRFVNLNLSEYNNLINPDKKLQFDQVAKRYALGKKDNWTQPNSVDVKSVSNSTSINNYISKYFSKTSSGNVICNELDTEVNSKNLRLWFCSRSLSKLNTVSDFVEAVNFSARYLVEGVKTVRKVFYQYCICLYYDINKLPPFCKKELSIILRKYAHEQNYIAYGT